MPQSGWISGDSRCRARQTGCSGGSRRSWNSGGGKISSMSRRKPWSNSGSLQQASANRKPPCSTYSRMFCFAAAENSGTRWPLKNKIGAWSRSCTVASEGSTICQVKRLFQSREMIATRLRTSSGSLFQSENGAWRSLLISTGARPLARNRSAKLVATSSFSCAAPRQNPESGFWSWTSSSAPSRYQSCGPKNRMPASRPARSIP